MAKAIWNIRHKRTNILVGRLRIDLPSDATDPRYSPRLWTIPVCVPIEIARAGGGLHVRPGETRSASVWINTRRSLGTLWVDKVTELYGIAGYKPVWSIPDEDERPPAERGETNDERWSE